MVEKIKELLKNSMSKERYHHSLCVAKEAKNLAEHYKGNEEKAYLAGLLHDITKEFADKKQLEIIKKNHINLTKVEKSTNKLWHAITAPCYIKEELKISDKEILNAVRYHTTGRKKMEFLEKIIFLADFISEDRFAEFTGVKVAKELAYKNLDEGVLHELSHSITILISKESPLSLESVKAYNYYLALRKEKNK